MTKVKRFLGLLFAAPLAIAMSVMSIAALPLAPAAAGTPNCSVGYSCLWDGTNYTTPVIGVSLNSGDLTGSARNNQASSAQANGGECTHTYFFDGASPNYSNYMVLLSTTAMPVGPGGNYDPDLSSVVTSVGTSNWNNKISSWKYEGC